MLPLNDPRYISVYFDNLGPLQYLHSILLPSLFNICRFTCSFVSPGKLMKTVLCWSPAFATMWPDWCTSTLKGTNCVSWWCGFWIFFFSFPSSWQSCSAACCRMKTEQSKKYFLQLQDQEQQTLMINPKPCGWYCCCNIKCCKQVRLWDGRFIQRALATLSTFCHRLQLMWGLDHVKCLESHAKGN